MTCPPVDKLAFLEALALCVTVGLILAVLVLDVLLHLWRSSRSGAR